jgi:hypothetical protein
LNALCLATLGLAELVLRFCSLGTDFETGPLRNGEPPWENGDDWIGGQGPGALGGGGD